MSSFCNPIERSFICRTNNFIKQYNNDRYDATALLNSLLGLLVVPFEKYDGVFNDCDKNDNGITILFNELKMNNRYDDCGNANNARGIIRRLRNSISHFHVETKTKDNEIVGFIFTNPSISNYCNHANDTCEHIILSKSKYGNTFRVELTIDEIKQLADIIKIEFLEICDNADCDSCDYNN